MMKKMVSRLFVLMTIFVFAFSQKAYAVENEKQLYVFYGTDGAEIEYYKDEDGHPYVLADGEMQYILLPLPEFKVTDPEKIRQLEAVRTGTNMQRSVPTSYVDLSTGAAGVASAAYSASVSFKDEAEFTTSVLKYNRYHSTLRIKVKDVVKNNIFTGSKISYNIYYYNEAFDEWSCDTYTDKDCTGSNGIGYVFTPSTMTYGMFDIYKSSDLKSFTINIWTTP